MTGEKKKPSDTDIFYHEYFAKHSEDNDSKEYYSFLLGYYSHLITDADFQWFIREPGRVRAAWDRVKADERYKTKIDTQEETWDTFKRLNLPVQLTPFCFGRDHIYFLFSDFIWILLFPPVSLCLFIFGCGKAPFFAAPDTEIFFLSLILPSAVFIQRTDSQEDVCVGIMSVRVMDGKISTHSLCGKIISDILGRVPH